MDATTAVIGIVVVVVALCGYLFVPEWLRKRRMDRDLQKREYKGHVPPYPTPPPAPPKKDFDSGGTE